MVTTPVKTRRQRVYHAIWEHTDSCTRCQFYRERANDYAMYTCVKNLPIVQEYVEGEGYVGLHPLLEYFLDEWSSRFQLVAVHPTLFGEDVLATLEQGYPGDYVTQGPLLHLVHAVGFLVHSSHMHITVRCDRPSPGFGWWEGRYQKVIWVHPTVADFVKWSREIFVEQK